MRKRRIILAVVAVVVFLGGVRSVNHWYWTERCVKHHAEFCNADGHSDGQPPWWATH